MNRPEPYAQPDEAAIRRRLRLRVLAKLMLATAFLAVVFVFLSAFLSGDKPGDPVPGLQVDIGDMAAGEMRTVIWEGRPIIVHRRDAAQRDALLRADAERDAGLRDPSSKRSEQPAGADPALRSMAPDWFVAIALGTDYGCPVKPVAEPTRENGIDVAFVDDCRGSRYDAAGRVLAGDYADRNLVVPAHTIDGDTLILGR